MQDFSTTAFSAFSDLETSLFSNTVAAAQGRGATFVQFERASRKHRLRNPNGAKLPRPPFRAQAGSVVYDNVLLRAPTPTRTMPRIAA